MIYDKMGRALGGDDAVVRAGTDTLGRVQGTGRKYATVLFFDSDQPVKVDGTELLIVKQFDGVWVADWDQPRPEPGRRIAWSTRERGPVFGYVSRAHFFSISQSVDRGEGLILRSKLPGLDREYWLGERDDLKEKAEGLWEGWLKSRGAVLQDPWVLDAQDRVRAFLGARKAGGSMVDPEDITGIETRDGIFYLKVADLELLSKENGK